MLLLTLAFTGMCWGDNGEAATAAATRRFSVKSAPKSDLLRLLPKKGSVSKTRSGGGFVGPEEARVLGVGEEELCNS